MKGSYLHEIPDSYFSPYKVTESFRAKVWYRIQDNKVIVENVLIGIDCLRFLNSWGGIKLANDIEEAVYEMCIPLIKEDKIIQS